MEGVSCFAVQHGQLTSFYLDSNKSCLLIWRAEEKLQQFGGTFTKKWVEKVKHNLQDVTRLQPEVINYVHF